MDFQLRTEVDVRLPDWDLNYQTPAFFIGSCFSDSIGRKLEKSKFPVMLNPFGVLYNPVSICNSLNTIIDKTIISEQELIQHDKLYHSFLFHGSFSSNSSDSVIDKCNKSIIESNEFLKKSSFIFITFGTSRIYKYTETGQIVSNCHKIPESRFIRYRLSVAEIVSEWNLLIIKLREFNPDIKIVFTVSPVRHFKDGAHENQLSKSVLLLAIDEIIKINSDIQLCYFPAYEIINDELRDYRYYSEDMVHISETGIKFVFEKFKNSFFNKKTLDCFKEINEIVKASEHRILTGDPVSLKKFSNTMFAKTEKLSSLYPNINFGKELEHFRNLGYIE